MNMTGCMMLGFTVCVCLLVCCASVSNAQDCCQQLGIPSKCHFLCGTRRIEIFSLTTYKCTHDHGASVAKCKVSSAIDYVKLFGQRFTETIRKGFSKLSAGLQEKLSDAHKFASATVDELKTVPEDILSAVDSVKGMTVSQLKGLATRLKSFTSENLRKLFKNVNIDVIFQSMQELSKNVWDIGQLRVLAETAYRKYGQNITRWTANQVKTLGNIIAGITPSDLAKMGASAFDQSLETICKAKLRIHQKVSLLKPATEAFGDISSWKSPTITRLCNLIEALTPDEMLKLSAKEVTSALDDIKKLFLDEPQVQALLKKVKENLGDVSKWSKPQIEKLGKLVKGLLPSDIKSIDKEKIKDLLAELGKVDWDISQVRQLGSKAKEALGLPDNWTSTQLKNAQKILKGLVKSELEKIKDSDLMNNLNNLKNVNWTTDQAQVVLEKLKKSTGLGTLDKSQIISIANTLDAFASSDVGKLSQAVLLVAMPELVIVKAIATPVLREFIRVYKSQPGNDINIGSFANALTRMELNQRQITDILASLEKLTGTDWDEAQVAELIVKVRTKLGDLNLTDSTDSDNPPWGFKNLAKLGKVVVGLTKDELKEFPIRGIDDSMEVLGKQSGWRRGQIISLLKRMKDYWKMQNQNITSLSEIDIEILGKFVQGFTMQELKKLPSGALDMAIRKLGEQTGLPEDKLKSRAYMAVEHFKTKTGVDVLETNQLQSLGNLVVGLSKDALGKISKNAFLSELYNIARKPGMGTDKLKELVNLLKKHFGQSDVGKWLTEHWSKLGPAVKTMDVNEIQRINKEAFEDMIDKFGEMDGWSVDQAKALVAKAKTYWNQEDVSKWTGAQLRRLGSLIKGFDMNELKKVSQKAFADMIGTCAHYQTLNKETIKALADRAKQVIASNDVSKFNFTDIKMLGCAVTGLSKEDLAKLKMDIDVIAELGKHTGWDTEQLKTIVGKAKSFFQNNFRDDYLMSLGNLIKGYMPEDIKKISNDSFKYAAGKLGKVEGLSVDQLKALASKAKEAWGNNVGQWTSSQISEAGKILGGLSASDISKIKKNAVDLISTDALKKMDPNQIKAFTTEQFMSMDSTQVNELTTGQKSLLSPGQTAALKGVQQDDPKDPDPWTCSGGTCSGARQISFNGFTILAGLVLAVLAWRQ